MKKVKCTRKAKKLLRESIIKWEEAHTEFVLDEWLPEHGSSNCPLCLEYCAISFGDHYKCWRVGDCPFIIDNNRCVSFNSKYDINWARLRTVKSHLAMITYMKDLYKRCEVVK